jgi:hypothetical protein
LAKTLTLEKSYMLSNIVLKFNEFSLLDSQDKPFSNYFEATASSVLTHFFSIEEVIEMPTKNLISYICKKRNNRFPNPEKQPSSLSRRATFLSADCMSRYPFTPSSP